MLAQYTYKIWKILVSNIYYNRNSILELEYIHMDSNFLQEHVMVISAMLNIIVAP
jgi:hypothetical protein